MHVIISQLKDLVLSMATIFGCTTLELEAEADQFVVTNDRKNELDGVSSVHVNNSLKVADFNDDVVRPVTVEVDKAMIGYPVFTVTLHCYPNRIYQARHRFRVFKSFNQLLKQLLPDVSMQTYFPNSTIRKMNGIKLNSDYLKERKSSLEHVCAL